MMLTPYRRLARTVLVQPLERLLPGQYHLRFELFKIDVEGRLVPLPPEGDRGPGENFVFKPKPMNAG